MGPCLPLCSNLYSFNNNPYISGKETSCLWSFEKIMLSHSCDSMTVFYLLKSSGSSSVYFSFHDAPKLFSWWKVWTEGRPAQHLDSSITKPCCCSLTLTCWFMKGPPWKYIPFSIKDGFPDLQAVHFIGTNGLTYN